MFETILGNEHIKKYFRKAFQKNSLVNSFLLVGPDGIGKNLFARDVAFHLLNSDFQDEEKKENILPHYYHPDLHTYMPEGKNGMHTIVNIRKMISQVFLSPFKAKAKVFIIHDAERMLPSSSNALLKTLEEPDLDSYIFLLTANESLVLPTIVSRCVKLQFYPLLEKQIADYIVKKHQKSVTEAQYISAVSFGSIGKAEEILSHGDYHNKRNLLLSILSENFSWSYIELFDALEKLDSLFPKEKLQEEGQEAISIAWRKEVEFLFLQISMWYRDLYLLKQKIDRRHLFFADHLSLLQAQDISRLAPLEKILEWLDEAKLGIDRNIKLITCLETFFLKLTQT